MNFKQHDHADQKMRKVAVSNFSLIPKRKRGIAEMEVRMIRRFGDRWADQMIDLSNPLILALCAVIEKMQVTNPVTFFGALRLASERMLYATAAGNDNVFEASERTLGWLPMNLTEGEIGELLDDVDLLSSLSEEDIENMDPYDEDL